MRARSEMDPLLDELIAKGTLDASGLDWARRHQAEHGGAISSVLLELDLVDEEDLVRDLSSSFRIKAASPEDFRDLSSELAARFPLSFSRAFDLCPLRLERNQLVVLLHAPLSKESSEELRELFGLEIRPLICHPLALTLARNRVYGLEPDERTQKLEARLARRHKGPRVRDVLERISASGSFSAAASDALAFANKLLDFAVFVRPEGAQLRIAGAGERTLPPAIGVPDAGGTLAVALRHGSYFMGPIGGGPADQRFFSALGRAVPRSAFVAPVPSTSERTVLLYADNGPLGMAPRWLAELTLVVARLGHRASAHAAPASPLQGRAQAPAPMRGGLTPPIAPDEGRASASSAEPATSRAGADVAAAAATTALSASEQVLVARLRAAAERAGLGLEEFVDKLLGQRERAAQPVEEATVALMGEVHGLFERLATAIPAQLALGMQNAFRDIVPRLAPAQPVASAAEPRNPSPAAAAGVGLVMTEAKPREVPSYDSRRRKAAVRKL